MSTELQLVSLVVKTQKSRRKKKEKRNYKFRGEIILGIRNFFFNMQPNCITQASTKISRKLNGLSVAQSECTIYRVHGHLRNINGKAYEPEVLAIGPYHRDKDNIKVMEDHKLHYLHLLLQRKNENVDKYVSTIGSLEQEARKCYANPFNLDATEFIEMLVLDGCFIIELVRKCNMLYLREKNDPIFRMDWIINSLQRDLMLFENQIPLFVLWKLFDLIEVPNQHARLMYLLTGFFSTIFPGIVYIESSNRSSHEIKHLLDLIHINLLSSVDCSVLGKDVKDKGKRLRFIDNATWLREANVKFKRNEGISLFNISFKNGTMFLPRLTIEDRTESFLRNLIAYEQYFQDSQASYVTDFVKFFDCLIDSSRDVEILSRFGIIDNWLGDDGVVANMFNKLTDSVTGPGNGFIYGKIFDKVNKHCNKRRNRWMAKLRRNYLNSPWAIISIIAAVVLLLLTVTQTVFSILQVVHK